MAFRLIPLNLAFMWMFASLCLPGFTALCHATHLSPCDVFCIQIVRSSGTRLRRLIACVGTGSLCITSFRALLLRWHNGRCCILHVCVFADVVKLPSVSPVSAHTPLIVFPFVVWCGCTYVCCNMSNATCCYITAYWPNKIRTGHDVVASQVPAQMLQGMAMASVLQWMLPGRHIELLGLFWAAH